MEQAEITVSMAEFVKDYLSKTTFTLDRIENMARRSVIYPADEALTVRCEGSFVHITPDSIRDYFGQRLQPAPEDIEQEKMETPGADFVSRDPQGLEDVPPEAYIPKRRRGRHKKA